MTTMRLQAFTPNGAALGPLPTPLEASASWVLNDLGALTLSYPYRAARADLLGQPLEVAVETSADGVTWAEPQGGRFLYVRDARDPVKDDAWSADCPAYVTRMKKAVVGFTGLDADGRRTFTNRSVGFILQTLLAEAQARGALVGLSWDFSNATDSSGEGWSGPAASVTITYDVGRDLLAILQEFAGFGWVDFTSQGRTVQVYNPGAGSSDWTGTATPVTLRRGQDLTEAPMRRTWENLANRALVLGDGGVNTTRTAVGATAPWGPQETFVAAAGVTDTGTLAAVGDAALTLTKEARTEYTVGQAFGVAGGPYRPFRDYFPGDWVYLHTSTTTAPLRVRVRQVTLTRGSNGEAAGNVVLNDRFTENDVTVQRRLESLTNGASTVGTGTPTGVGPDILAPAPPATPTVTSSSYLQAATGLPAAQITVDWPDVTTNADGTPLTDLKGYQVQRRKTGGTWATFAADVTTSLHTSSPYEPGAAWEFRVRAVDTAGNESSWSPGATVTAAYDTTGPTAPKVPTLLTRLGGMQVQWDGLDSDGDPMDTDTDRVEVHVSTVNAFTPTKGDPATLRGTIRVGGGGLFVGSLPYGVTYFVRFLPVDTSGNAGTPSAQASVEVKPLVDVSNFPDDAMEVLYARTGHFIEVTADMIAANAIDGMVITGATIQTDAAPDTGLKLDTSGLRAYDAGGDLVVSIDPDGATSLVGPTIATASSGERMVLRSDSGIGGTGVGGILESYVGLAGETAAFIDPDIELIGGVSRPQWRIRSGRNNSLTTPKAAQVSVTAGGNAYPSAVNVDAESFSVGGGSLNTLKFARLSGGITWSDSYQRWWPSSSGGPGLTWLNGFSTAATQEVQFMRDPSDNVHVVGAVNKPAGSSSGTAAFTLPVNYRPLWRTMYAVVRTNAVGTTALMTVETNGNVRFYFTGTPTAFGCEIVFSRKTDDGVYTTPTS